MRRLLTLLLLVILPLQFSYAVAASYCQHEDGKNAAHFGHHVHVHKVSDHSDQAGKGKPKGKISVDNDCAGCHWSKAELLSQPTGMPALLTESTPPVGNVSLYSSADPHRIERPNWLLPL